MLHPSTKLLIEKLAEMTRKKRVSWVEGENGQIYHDTEGYRVTLTPAPHAILLTDALGKELETVTPEEYTGESDGHGRGYDQFISELYRDAGRHARGTERAIEAVLANLDLDGDGVPDLPVPTDMDVQDMERITDETTAMETMVEGQADMTEAVATMAEQVEAAETDLDISAELDDMIMPEPEIEPEIQPAAPTTSRSFTPAGFGTSGTAEHMFGAPEAEAEIEPAAAFEDVGNFGLPEIPSDTQTSNPQTGDEPVMPPVAGSFVTPEFDPRPDTAELDPLGQGAETDIAGMVEALAAVTPETDMDTAPPEDVEPTPQPRSFSLSGISSGFGIGATTPEPEAPQVQDVQDTQDAFAEDAPQESAALPMIDGTLDLPDLPESPIRDGIDAIDDLAADAGGHVRDAASDAGDAISGAAETGRDTLAGFGAAALGAAGAGFAAAKDTVTDTADTVADGTERIIDDLASPDEEETDDLPEPPTPKSLTRFNPWN